MLISECTTIGELLRELTILLSPVATDLAEREAETIVDHLFDFDYSMLRLHLNDSVTAEHTQQVQQFVDDRLTGKPLPYVLGSTFFFNKDFHLSNETLIPRHDTEHLIAHILENQPSSPQTFLELGTGSGIIPEVLCIENPQWKAVSVDICEATQITALKNCSNAITLVTSDSFSAIKENKQFDFIVSNPPYIPHYTVENELDDSVRFFEPHRALDGGDDGLDFYRYLAEFSAKYLKDGGKLYLEIGYDQGESVPKLLSQNGATNIQVINDFGNRPRVVSCKF